MRLVPGAVLALVAFLAMSVPALAIDSASERDSGLPSAISRQTSKVGENGGKKNIQTVANINNQLHEADFIYIPPPPPVSDDPLFYSDAFEYVPATNGARAGELVRPVSGVIPVSSVARLSRPGATVGGTGGTPTVSPTPTAVAHPAAPLDKGAALTEGSDPVGLSSLPAVYAAIAVPPKRDVEDPRFYRGSFVHDPDSQSLLPQSRQRVTLPAAASAPATIAGSSSTLATFSGNAPSASYGAATSFPRRGRAMYYNPGIMQSVLSVRLDMGQVGLCSECVGYVALMGSEDLNHKVWLEWEDGDVEGPFLVIDTAAKQHVALLLSRNWVVDVDYATAMRRGMNRPLPVTVWASPPRRQDQKSTSQDGQFYYTNAPYVH